MLNHVQVNGVQLDAIMALTRKILLLLLHVDRTDLRGSFRRIGVKVLVVVNCNASCRVRIRKLLHIAVVANFDL